MNCPKCNSYLTKVYDNLPNSIRRRLCQDCGFRFKTVEYPIDKVEKPEEKEVEVESVVEVEAFDPIPLVIKVGDQEIDLGQIQLRRDIKCG